MFKNDGNLKAVLKGRLGNQLFIFAASKRWSQDIDRKVTLVVPQEFSGVLPSLPTPTYFQNRVELRILRFKHMLAGTRVTDDTTQAPTKNCSILLDGYFQNVTRLTSQNIQDVKEFLSQQPHQDFELDLIAKFQELEFGAIHWRRGDYQNETNVKIYEQIDLKSLLEAVGKRKKDMPYYIFSDSPFSSEEKRVLRDYDVEIFDQNNLSPWTVLEIMAGASKIVISNSTFSLWAAILSSTDHWTQISYPSRWFKGVKTPNHFYLEHWTPYAP